MTGALPILLFLGLGAGAGAVHFRLLAHDARLLVGGGPVAAALAVRLGRFVLTLLVLVLAAKVAGWPALLAAAAGFGLARPVMLRRLGRVAGRATTADAGAGPGPEPKPGGGA